MTPQLNTALAKAKLEFPAILANRTVRIPTKSGRAIEFTYAELEEIIEAVTPTLSANGLCISSQIKYLENNKLVLATSLRHESGEYIESCYPLPDIVADAKELGSAISYGRRYNAICLLEITTTEPSDQRQWDEKKRKLAVELRKEINQIEAPKNPQRADISPKPQIDRNLLLTEIDSLIDRRQIDIAAAQKLAIECVGVSARSKMSDQQLLTFRDALQTWKSL